MQRLPNPPLVPSSMNATNTIKAAGPGHEMTAAGSPSVIADVQPAATDVLPLPVASGPAIPVSNNHGRVQGNPPPMATGPWTQPGNIDEGAVSPSPWKQT